MWPLPHNCSQPLSAVFGWCWLLLQSCACCWSWAHAACRACWQGRWSVEAGRFRRMGGALLTVRAAACGLAADVGVRRADVALTVAVSRPLAECKKMYLNAWCGISQETLADTSSTLDKKDFLVTIEVGRCRWLAACGCQAWSLTAEHRHPVLSLMFKAVAYFFNCGMFPALPRAGHPRLPQPRQGPER